MLSCQRQSAVAVHDCKAQQAVWPSTLSANPALTQCFDAAVCTLHIGSDKRETGSGGPGEPEILHYQQVSGNAGAAGLQRTLSDEGGEQLFPKWVTGLLAAPGLQSNEAREAGSKP